MKTFCGKNHAREIDVNIMPPLLGSKILSFFRRGKEKKGREGKKKERSVSVEKRK